MVNSTSSVERISALAGHYKPVDAVQAGVTLSEIRNLTLWQFAVWPDSLEQVSASIAKNLGVDSAPGFCCAESNGAVAIMRIEPCKFWVYGAELSPIEASQGAVLDLSHSRTHIRVAGAQATTVLNSYLPLDLREQSFPVGTVASTAFHHVGVTLWRSAEGYELLVPRGFAVSLWELLCEASAQYELTIAQP